MNRKTILSPMEVALLSATSGLTPLQMRRLNVMMRAMISGLWPIPLDEIKALDMDRFAAVCDELESKYLLTSLTAASIKRMEGKTFRYAFMDEGRIVERCAVGVNFLSEVEPFGIEVKEIIGDHHHSVGLPTLVDTFGPEESNGTFLYWSDAVHAHVIDASREFIPEEEEAVIAAIEAAHMTVSLAA